MLEAGWLAVVVMSKLAVVNPSTHPIDKPTHPHAYLGVASILLREVAEVRLELLQVDTPIQPLSACVRGASCV